MAPNYLIKFQTQIITIRNQHTTYWDTKLIFMQKLSSQCVLMVHSKKNYKNQDNFVVQWVMCWCLTPIVLDQELCYRYLETFSVMALI